jgi:hypothetical protein
MSWPSVRWGEIKHSEVVVNEDPIFILGSLVPTLTTVSWGNESQPPVEGSSFSCEAGDVTSTWQGKPGFSGYILYLSILLDTLFSSTSTYRGNGGRHYDPNSHGSMACDICSSGVGNLIWEGPQIASMPCSIRSPQSLRALRRGPTPASRANLSQRSIPWDKSGHSTWV